MQIKRSEKTPPYSLTKRELLPGHVYETTNGDIYLVANTGDVINVASGSLVQERAMGGEAGFRELDVTLTVRN